MLEADVPPVAIPAVASEPAEEMAPPPNLQEPGTTLGAAGAAPEEAGSSGTGALAMEALVEILGRPRLPLPGPPPLGAAVRRLHEALDDARDAFREERAQLKEEKERLTRWQARLEREISQFQQDWAKAEEHEKLAEANLDQTRRALGKMAEDLGRREAAVRLKEATLSVKETELEIARVKLEVAQKAVEHDKGEIQRQRGELMDGVKHVEGWNERLNAREEALKAQAELIREADEAQKTVGDDLRAQEAALKEREDGLRAREVTLREREDALTARESSAARQADTLKVREDWVKSKEAGLKEREDDLSTRERALEQRAQEVAAKKTEEVRALERSGLQRLISWAGEANSALVPFGLSPIQPPSSPSTLSDAFPVLDAAAERLRRLDQVVGDRLEAEGRELAQAVAEHVLTCFRSHDPSIPLEPVILGAVAATEDEARQGVQGVARMVAAQFDRNPQ